MKVFAVAYWRSAVNCAYQCARCSKAHDKHEQKHDHQLAMFTRHPPAVQNKK